MYKSALWLMLAIAVNGQAQPRRATFLGGGSAGQGKCTIEVVVDGAAEVSVRGDEATLRNLSGQPAQWRRFQCTGPMPSNPADFRFAGVDGRGRQELMRDPRQGGSAVVRIEDPQGGSEGYTFDLFWGGGGGGYPGRDSNGGGGGYREPVGRSRWGRDEAVRGCQDAVRQQAAEQYGGRRIEFLDGQIDDQPGRNDWIVGRINMSGGGRPEQMRYSCSVDFQSGRVRSASVEPIGGGGGYRRDSDAGTQRAIGTCQRAAEDRIRRDGYNRVEFTSTRMDDQPGRNDWVIGTARAYRGPNFESYTFNCSVNLRDGDVRSVDVRRRD
jgi:hypothetical protein